MRLVTYAAGIVRHVPGYCSEYPACRGNLDGSAVGFMAVCLLGRGAPASSRMSGWSSRLRKSAADGAITSAAAQLPVRSVRRPTVSDVDGLPVPVLQPPPAPPLRLEY
jgi:hypothetical protein